MLLALAAYATYVVNASQFLLKLRAARLDAGASRASASQRSTGTGVMNVRVPLDLELGRSRRGARPRPCCGSAGSARSSAG